MHKKRAVLEQRWEEVFAKEACAASWLANGGGRTEVVPEGEPLPDAAVGQPDVKSSSCCSGLTAAKKTFQEWLGSGGSGKTPAEALEVEGPGGASSPRSPDR